MRTTLDLEPDVLAAARELARQQRVPIGRVISSLARQALREQRMPGVARTAEPLAGFEPFPPRGRAVTNDIIDRLREGGPI
ncbi:putative antitoxin VapB38 [Tepidimonas sediminis]|uniref:Putative antitoxin VapB38 n=1 Tax=Tepidimonas sediminis TaxID=2588941 RepID=A0A554WR96_9BURK|nr:hypothetical protein [Tepidimonas sediminis]TSE26084.1 putative antitoxin VapB38 [Tepidimonas sediminis]